MKKRIRWIAKQERIPWGRKIFLIILAILTWIYLFIVFLLPLNLNKLPYSTIIYDTNNIEIWEIVSDNKIRHRELEIDEIPDFYKKALILLEDKSFYYNNWISVKWLIRSTINNIKSKKVVEWGSTISAQLIRNNLWLNEKRDLSKKLLEFLYAMRLNWKLNKDEILKEYINSVYYGYLNYWLESAANYYFGKNSLNLTQAEQIALLILPKDSTKFDPYKNPKVFKERFDKICDYLKNNKLITDEENNLIKNEKLIWKIEQKNKLPYVKDFVKNNLKEDKSQIQTTIDYALTNKVIGLSESVLQKLIWKDVWDYSVIILDKKTNDLKVMIGWLNYYSKEWQVNSSLALRQPGSTIKPFVYTLAFKNLWLKPEDTITDLPVQYSTTEWYSYSPKNYTLDYKWEITIAEALSQSINIPAVKTIEKVWVSNTLAFLKQVGITSLTKNEDYYWLALALGDWEVSLYELTQAFSIFAHDGDFCNINYLAWEKTKCKNVIEKKYTDMTNFILTNRYFKVRWFPINSTLDFADKNVFLKTWTSRNFRDNWTVWYTDNYVIWVWAGNKDGSFMKWVSWASWAWEIFAAIVNNLEQSNKEKNPEIISKNTKEYLEITSPLSNSTYKIDNFKSIESQKIKSEFSTNINYDSSFWFLDWKKIAENFIVPTIWNHKLEIIIMKDWEIKKKDSVEFRVEE